jgi:hypothetical protein
MVIAQGGRGQRLAANGYCLQFKGAFKLVNRRTQSRWTYERADLEQKVHPAKA